MTMVSVPTHPVPRGWRPSCIHNTCPAAEITGIAAADIVHDFLSMFLSTEPPAPRSMWAPAKDEL